MTEYIVLLGLIAILLIPAVVAFRDALRAAFEKSSAEIQEEVTSKIK
jgi:Flp pilus assembly pilin Flp